ncbi:OsmC family protein [bacterium]|nr:OsmC family protein [bacterium]
MVDIDVVYKGDLHCEATHGPSSSRIETDAPRDNEGKGEKFSPTDLVGAALGTCMVTIMGIYAKKQGIDISGTRVHVVKEMAAQPTRRIARLSVRIEVPRAFEERYRRGLEQAAKTCPVHASLHPDIEAPVEFVWGK